MINFTAEDVKSFRDIIQEYRDVSNELSVYQKKAEDIKEKVRELEKNLNAIKSRETKLMEELHSKYGNFGLQDIYERLLRDELMK